MSKVLLGATGSVAAVRVPLLFGSLINHGHTVRVVATDPAAYFFDPAPFREHVTLDADEWPGRAEAKHYERGDIVRHIELRNWADVFVIAPLDANTLAKLAVGLCDNALTCIWRAWDWNKPVLLAPAMNTLMWRHPFTRKHLRALAADFGSSTVPVDLDEDELVAHINAHSAKLRVAAPISKTLACGEDGIGAMAEVPAILGSVEELLQSAE